MAPSGTVTTYIDGDISGLRKATRDASKEFQNVARAADKANTDAARGAAKAFGGISKLIATGKVSAKSLDKIGRSASGAISAASGFAGGIGAALGLAGVPAAAELAAVGIKALRDDMKSLKSETREAAAAQRDYTVAQLAASGSADGVSVATEAAAAATRKLADARKSGTATAQQIVDLERAERSAAGDVIVAKNAQADATQKAKDAQSQYAAQMAQVIDKSKQLAPELAAANGGFLNQHVYALAAAKALRTHADSAENLTADQRAAERAVADYIEKTDEIPEDIKTLISTPGMNPALDRFNQLQAKANALDGKQITITTHLDTIIETHRLGLATGGRIGATSGMRIGGRFDGRDDIPINVSRGEVILNPQQQTAVEGGASIDQALAGAPTVRAGGGFKAGGKREDRDLDSFLGGSILDRLALAQSTLTDTDDRSAAATARDRIERILRSGKLGKRQLTRTERRMLLEALGGYRRDALPPDLGSPVGGGDSSPDPFALDRARTAGRNEGLGLLAGTVFGGSGDIGTAQGGSALGSTMMVETLVLAPSVGNHATLADGSNRGNATSNRTRTYSPRSRVAW